ncbi:tetratricopeptide repeat protein [Actinoalloteichus caeruleus]|uniref:Tfp pilus assembly protein PilF n=1 Tax=Actinoalloteichus caeruleus DSM 43889 TaxID=1120930 RepID=A0ABT1JQB3_ACTCY|nr:tetratricopeptide repeat protein [Actinoalloteichus caeruleus]MCP2334336.1 Tfp pilus assembly protein PilF [Actinoalloteichus caeruleus DSM 43889]
MTAADPTTLFTHSEALLDLGRTSEAITVLEAGLAAWPSDGVLWGQLAKALVGNGEFQRALVAADNAVRGAPGDDWGHRLRSGALVGLGRLADAEVAAREAVRHNPHVWQTHSRLAEVLALQRKRLPEAVAAAEECVRLGPTEAGPHLLLARLALLNRRRDQAEEALRAALAIDPHNDQALFLLGQVQSDRARVGQAMATFRALLTVAPGQRATEAELARLGWLTARLAPMVTAAATLLLLVLALLLPDHAGRWVALGATPLPALLGLHLWSEHQRYQRGLGGYLRILLRTRRVLAGLVGVTCLNTLLLTGWWIGSLIQGGDVTPLLRVILAIALGSTAVAVLAIRRQRDERIYDAQPVRLWRQSWLTTLLALPPLVLLTALGEQSETWWYPPLGVALSVVPLLAVVRARHPRVVRAHLAARAGADRRSYLGHVLVAVTLLCGALTGPLWVLASLAYPALDPALMFVGLGLLIVVTYCRVLRLFLAGVIVTLQRLSGRRQR